MTGAEAERLARFREHRPDVIVLTKGRLPEAFTPEGRPIACRDSVTDLLDLLDELPGGTAHAATACAAGTRPG